jgi:hypothetical protein
VVVFSIIFEVLKEYHQLIIFVFIIYRTGNEKEIEIKIANEIKIGISEVIVTEVVHQEQREDHEVVHVVGHQVLIGLVVRRGGMVNTKMKKMTPELNLD